MEEDGGWGWEMPASRLFKKPTYLNVHGGSGRHWHNSRSNADRKKSPGIVRDSLPPRKSFCFYCGERASGVHSTLALLNLNGPVLVSGLENSCCRSLFSEVLSTTTMSAGRVSRFFSRNPSTLYMTWKKTRVGLNERHEWSRDFPPESSERDICFSAASDEPNLINHECGGKHFSVFLIEG